MKKFKKIFSFLLAFVLFFTLASCSQDENTGDESSSSSSSQASTVNAKGFFFHYYRDDSDYNNYNMWIWEKGGNGADYSFDGTDSYGAYMKHDMSEFPQTLKYNGLGFIVKEAKPWAENPEKDVADDRFIVFKQYTCDNEGYYHFYLKSGDETIYEKPGVQSDTILSFKYKYDTKTKEISIAFSTNKDYEDFSIIQSGNTIVSAQEYTEDKVIDKTEKTFEYSLGSKLPDLKNDVTLRVTFSESGKTKSETIDVSPLYRTTQFSDEYNYDGELGAIYDVSKTTFKVWSPVSKQLKLRIYNTGTPLKSGNVTFKDGSNEYQEYPMTLGQNGVWSNEIPGDLGGKYYTYVVTNYKYSNLEIVDPYAKSTGINGLRGMIVDFTKTNPDGFESIKINEVDSTKLTVYETHISDLTYSATWNGTEANRGTYKGFYEAGTTYKGVTTGFDHIKELGVNAIQILPFFDQANDERPNDDRTDGSKRTFNWGYNPLNYNSLEGVYSSNPYDGYTKITEFKELVKAYNEAGIDIIMDVVYNHVDSLDCSNFDVLMPRYYYRYTAKGQPSNGSGCGNETASEMYMFRKFMKDSTEFWATEYKIAGFRFDLMGVHDVETMNQLASNLHENVSEYITVYGEPWAGGTTALSGTLAAMQSNISEYEGYGCFNDKMRDALIKGGLNSSSAKGWITTADKKDASDVQYIKNGIKGGIVSGYFVPEKCVNYVTCHDNYTLYDRIKAAGIKDEDTIKKMAMLANSMVFTSQGVTFMLAGEEMLRTKKDNSNSYNASYEVNALDYELKVQNLDMFNNYKKLIALKQTGNLLSKGEAEVRDIVIDVNEDANIISYKLTDTVNNREYIFVHSNGYVGTSSKTMDLSGYTLYLDTLNVEGLELTASTVIGEYQTIIAYKSLN